ncbi:NAD(P)-dependent alcohol dehydrogenase [Agromyces bauzanensis]|uniref:NADPH:quinone reductase n=1 Tax=Agromyces bauzanensis TaxID=1308924 RepID=A0A917UR33_9MICO|nr:NAD(P)-dependent alcohol dehydrogenase [Agromyces bauzanensis]GGJ78006.1 NADPH:quinone reductase [Agromyces bauzanensis]
MRAIVLDSYGPPGRVMHLVEVPRPAPGPGEVLVRVRAVSVNSWDVDVVIGGVFNRMAAPFRPKHRIIGSDVAGEVVAVGEGVTRHRVGDCVFGELTAAGWGGFADFVAGPVDALVPLPAAVDDLTAAAMPQAASMALQALGDRRALEGRRVLIVGAGGGVGTFALQLATGAGARVAVVDRAAKLDRLRELGASDVFEAGAIPAAAGPFDRILDVVGALSAAELRRLLAPDGHAVAIGGRPRRILGYALAGARSAQRDGGRTVRLLAAVPNRDLPELAALVAAGSLRAIVDGPHPLDTVPHQLERLRAGEVFGKVVIVP